MEKKLEFGIPIPAPHQKRTVDKYKFHSWEVGNSMVDASDSVTASRLYNAAKRYESYHKYDGIKFTGRKIEDGLVRVWRVK